MQTKLSRLIKYMQDNDWIGALRLAAKFPDLGEQKKDITSAWAAYANPSFYIQINKDPKALIKAGIEALKIRYKI